MILNGDVRPCQQEWVLVWRWVSQGRADVFVLIVASLRRICAHSSVDFGSFGIPLMGSVLVRNLNSFSNCNPSLLGSVPTKNLNSSSVAGNPFCRWILYDPWTNRNPILSLRSIYACILLWVCYSPLFIVNQLFVLKKLPGLCFVFSGGKSARLGGFEVLKRGR